MPTVSHTQGASAPVPTTETSANAETLDPETILPDPVAALTMSGDPGAELAALAVQSGEAQQTVAQAGRDVEEKIEVSEDDQQVADMRQKANDIRSAGLWEGAGMMLEGAGAVGSAFAHTALVGDGLKGAGKVGNGVAMMAAAKPKAAEANDDADAAAAKSASDQAKGAAEDLHDAKKAGGDLVSAALDFYREYTSAQASAHTAALHRA
jgi:hypothetical protein